MLDEDWESAMGELEARPVPEKWRVYLARVKRESTWSIAVFSLHPRC